MFRFYSKNVNLSSFKSLNLVSRNFSSLFKKNFNSVKSLPIISKETSLLLPQTTFKPNFSKKRFFSKTSELPDYLLNMPPTNITTLPSNLRIGTEESFGETATIGVFIDSGSVYETEDNNGVAHFLEHMTFKGTNKRTRVQLEEEIENIGGILNAYTSREQTVYYAKVLKKDVPVAFDILSDILLNSKFDPAAIESERGTILREMEEVNKEEQEVVFDLLHSAAFQGTSLGRTILGPEENIKSIKRKDLVDYVQKNYHSPRIAIGASGAINHEEIVNLAQKSFASLPISSKPLSHPVSFTGSMITLRDDTLPFAHLLISFEAVNYSHPDYFTFLVLQQIGGSWDRTLGGGKNVSSHLCANLANEELAITYFTFTNFFRNTGMFGFYAATEPEKIEECIKECMLEWDRIAEGATDVEVERAKFKLKTQLLMSLDGTTAIAEDIGRQILQYGRRLTPAEVFKRIDSISVHDVKRVAKDYLTDTEPAVAAYGPTLLVPDYNNIRDWTYQRRW